MKKILIVDDDEIIRSLLVSLLESQDYTPLVCTGGDEALTVLQSEEHRDISVAVLDLMMPDISGLEVLKAIKASEATKHIPVVMLTCHDDAESVMDAYETGAEYYLTKPFTRTQLLHALEIILNKKATESSAVATGTESDD